MVDGAYRAPREINFWLGLILMKIVLGLSLTGRTPKFVKNFMEGQPSIPAALSAYVQAVKAVTFPAPEHEFTA